MQEIEKFLIELRAKPIQTRKTILIVATTAITIFVAIIWVYSLQGKLARLNGERAVASTASAPSSIIAKDASSFWGGISVLVDELKHQLSF